MFSGILNWEPRYSYGSDAAQKRAAHKPADLLRWTAFFGDTQHRVGTGRACKSNRAPNRPCLLDSVMTVTSAAYVSFSDRRRARHGGLIAQWLCGLLRL